MENIDEATSTTLPPTQFHYTEQQFIQLRLASDICTILSMIAILLVAAIYIHMLFQYPREVNRVSLRCVIGANTVTLIDHCMALKASHDKLETLFCFSFRILDGIFTIMSSCLLGLVGVHLFLVFVCHVHWPCRPDYILIPTAALYSIAASIIPFFNEELPANYRELINANNPVCWFYNAFLDRTYNRASWIYYYSFMFFIIVVSFFSSLTAMCKVYFDKAKNEKLMLEINSRGINAGSAPSSQVLKNIHQNNPNPIRKTVARSLLYPLMPALTYSLGFALQMYLINPSHTANYSFAMVGNVLARLAGVFTAMIFFADPYVQKVIKRLWLKCIHKITTAYAVTNPEKPHLSINHSEPTP